MSDKTRTIKLNGAEFILGRKYRDTVLGNEGIAIGGVSYLTGCDQLQITYNDATGRPVVDWIDVTNVEGVEVPEKAGGPPPIIPHRHP
jgi:hypothetical protein